MRQTSPPGGRRLAQLGGLGCLVTFGLFWSTLTLAADIAIGWGIFRRLRAWDDANRADRLASWLRERLRLRAADVLTG